MSRLGVSNLESLHLGLSPIPSVLQGSSSMQLEETFDQIK